MLPGDEEEFVPDGCYYPQLGAVVGVDGVQMTAWDAGREALAQTRVVPLVLFPGATPAD